MFENIAKSVCIKVFIALCGIVFTFCDNNFSEITLNEKHINQMLANLTENSQSSEMQIQNNSIVYNLTGTTQSPGYHLDVNELTIVPKSNMTFFEFFPEADSIATNISSTNLDTRGITISLEEFQAQNLKVINVIEDCGIIWLEWMHNDESSFELRYHQDPVFLRSYFNISMNDFDVLNESSVNAVHSMVIALPKAVVYKIQEQSDPVIYFAITEREIDGNRSKISNLAAAYFTKIDFFRSRNLETVLFSIVLTSVILAILVSVVAFVLARWNKSRRKSSFDFQKSDYYYETVTDMSA